MLRRWLQNRRHRGALATRADSEIQETDNTGPDDFPDPSQDPAVVYVDDEPTETETAGPR